MRPVWVGAISFGLVNIPVELITAESSDSLNFTMLDKRDNNRISYKKVNAVTGKPVPDGAIIKAYEWEEGQYVEVTPEDFKQAHVEATRTIDIQHFIPRDEMDRRYFEKPYYIKPQKSGQKAYVLLREALKKSDTIAVSMIVLRTRGYLSAIYELDDLLILNLLRYESELKDYDDLTIPEVNLTAREMQLATSLITDLTESWQPEQYGDEYRESLLATIRAKAEGKKIKKAPQAEAKPAGEVIDIVELLKQSVAKRGKGKSDAPKRVRKKA